MAESSQTKIQRIPKQYCKLWLTGKDRTLFHTQSGDRHQAEQMVGVVAGDRSGFGYDYVPIP